MDVDQKSWRHEPSKFYWDCGWLYYIQQQPTFGIIWACWPGVGIYGSLELIEHLNMPFLSLIGPNCEYKNGHVQIGTRIMWPPGLESLVLCRLWLCGF